MSTLRTSLTISCFVIALASTSSFATSQPNCWDMLDTDPLHTYSTNAAHNLPNGFVGYRNPSGSHTTPHPFTEMIGGVLRMDGGNGDALTVDVPVASVTPSWKLTMHYQTGPGCSTRELVQLVEPGGFLAYTLVNNASLNGTSTAFTSLSNTWYTMEVINNSNTNTAELRLWKDGDTRPAAALISTTATSSLAALELRAGNSCAPEKQIDDLCIENLNVVALEEADWRTIKQLYRD